MCTKVNLLRSYRGYAIVFRDIVCGIWERVSRSRLRRPAVLRDFRN